VYRNGCSSKWIKNEKCREMPQFVGMLMKGWDMILYKVLLLDAHCDPDAELGSLDWI
jgi:hypothetical protein